MDMKGWLSQANERTLIIAEIGSNHNGSFSLAAEMIARAAECGVDAVKFQVFKTEKFFTRKIPVFHRARSLGYKTQFDRFKDLEFSDEQIIRLSEIAKENRIVFLATPFDNDSVDLLLPLVPAFKIASADLINIPLLRYIEKKGKPVILSTGQAIVEEIDAAANIFHRDKLVLMHCVSAYPTPDEEVNLRSIDFLKDRYNVAIGYSDHSVGILACIAAVAKGARIIEKHFTLDKKQNFGDHPLSADFEDMKMLVNEIRSVERMMGVYGKECQPGEAVSKKQLRRSLHLRHDIEKGTVIKEDMIIPLVSGEGIPVNRIDDVAGKRAVRDLKCGDVICEDDLI
jgi:sialic acid synthase SpsE